LSFDISGERAWQGTESVLAQAHAIGDRWAHSHFSGDFKRNPDSSVQPILLGRTTDPVGSLGWNYDAWVQGMFEVGYEGYVNYEACTPTYLPNGELVPIEVIDERVQNARDFMRQWFDKHQPKEG
jgi:sugar phosphate isomerase/epimerase